MLFLPHWYVKHPPGGGGVVGWAKEKERSGAGWGVGAERSGAKVERPCEGVGQALPARVGQSIVASCVVKRRR